MPNLYWLFHAAQPVATVKATPGQTVQAIQRLARAQLDANTLERDPSFTTERMQEILPSCAVRLALPGIPTIY